MQNDHSPIIPNRPQLHHGGDYNPDQWLHRPEILEQDARLMREAGVNAVSLGIFAWAALEPAENHFEWEWLDRCMDRLHDHDVGVFLATPTAARPLWLAHAHPEVRLTLRNGTRQELGGRHNFCRSSPVYRERSQIIIDRLAARYADHPALLGWHINNEYGGSTEGSRCYCARCVDGFQRWLRQRYDDDLESLNRSWWTSFWSHQYQSWDQILPCDHSNGGLMLNWCRFQAELVADFCAHEVAAVRRHSSAPVTTNFHGLATHIDEWRCAQHIDFTSYDSYPQIEGNDHDIDSMADVAWHNARMRSLKGGRSWLLLESCPSQPQYKPIVRAKRPGVHRLLSLQNVAGGSDGAMYFQWRAGRGGIEKLHGAVCMWDAPTDTRVFREVATLGDDLARLGQLAGARTPARIAVLWDSEQTWSWECNSAYYSIEEPRLRAKRWQALAWRANLACDVVDPRDPVDAYDLIIVAGMPLLRADTAERLVAAADRGATVLMDAFSAWYDDDLCMLPGGRLGPDLRALFGIRCEEVDCLRADESKALTGAALPAGCRAIRHCDLIHAEDCAVLASYDEDFYAGQPALTRRAHGNGQACYLACDLDDADKQALLIGMAQERGIAPPLAAIPPGVVVNERQTADTRFLFIMNPQQESRRIDLPAAACDARDGSPLPGACTLGPWSVRVVCLPAD